MTTFPEAEPILRARSGACAGRAPPVIRRHKSDSSVTVTMSGIGRVSARPGSRGVRVYWQARELVPGQAYSHARVCLEPATNTGAGARSSPCT